MPVPRSPFRAGSLRRLPAFLGTWPSSWTSGVSARMAVFDFPPTPQGSSGHEEPGTEADSQRHRRWLAGIVISYLFFTRH